MVLRSADGRDLLISRVRLRQYSSIAYSLRAVLGVQQDNLLFGADVLPLEPEGVDALKEACDLATLATLMVADEAARVANAQAIEPDALTAAWSRTIGADQFAEAGRAVSTAEAKQVIMEMVEEKLAAYEAYNEIPREKTGPLLLVNTQRFYARYPVPRTQENRDALLATVNYTIDMFLNGLLTRAGQIAEAHGRDVIRASDANEALQQMTPHVIDDFEDAHFFFRLGPDQVVLESYDTDSFRDLGLHWWFLGRAYGSTLHDFAPVDPFAAEVVTEGVSQYAVLLLRLAGQIAEANGVAPVLLRQRYRRGPRTGSSRWPLAITRLRIRRPPTRACGRRRWKRRAARSSTCPINPTSTTCIAPAPGWASSGATASRARRRSPAAASRPRTSMATS